MHSLEACVGIHSSALMDRKVLSLIVFLVLVFLSFTNFLQLLLFSLFNSAMVLFLSDHLSTIQVIDEVLSLLALLLRLLYYLLNLFLLSCLLSSSCWGSKGCYLYWLVLQYLAHCDSLAFISQSESTHLRNSVVLLYWNGNSRGDSANDS